MASTRSVRVIAVLLMIAGAALVVAGAATALVVRDQLVAENITIPDDAIAFQGKRVDGPLDAYVQADIISKHALEATGGKTYAELPQDDPTRAVVMNGSFLRASLFTSVMAFGVAAFAIGMGVVVLLVGVALRRLAVAVVAPAPAGPATV